MAEEAIPIVDGLEDMSDLVDEVVPIEKEIVTDPPAVKKVEAKKDPPADKVDDEIEIPDDLGLENDDAGDEDVDVPTDEDISAFKDLSKAQEACKVMRTQIVQLKKAGGNGEAAAALQARVDELEAAQAGTDLTRTPGYQETYVAPIKAVVDSIQAIATENAIDVAILRQAMTAESKERVQLLKSATDDHDSILEIVPLMQELDKLRDNASKAISDAQANYKTAQETKAAAAVESRKTILESTLSELGKVHFLLRDSAKKPDWMKGIRAAATSILDGSAKPEDVAKVALKAQVADHYLAMFTKTHNQLLAVQNQLDKLRGVRPRNDARGGGDPKPGDQKDLDKVMSLDELVEV